MRLVLDACVLFPTVMREMLVGAAGRGLFQPVWSARILEEWARATHKLGPAAEPIARTEIALLRSDWPEAEVEFSDIDMDTLSLPDADDRHVLAAAIAAGADGIVTVNLKDFPTRVLGQYGLLRRNPDELLLEAFHTKGDMIPAVAQTMLARAEAASGRSQELRALLKRAKLPRLAKVLG